MKGRNQGETGGRKRWKDKKMKGRNEAMTGGGKERGKDGNRFRSLETEESHTRDKVLKWRESGVVKVVGGSGGGHPLEGLVEGALEKECRRRRTEWRKD